MTPQNLFKVVRRRQNWEQKWCSNPQRIKAKNFTSVLELPKLQTIGLHNLVSWMGQTRSYVLNKTMFVFFAFKKFQNLDQIHGPLIIN